MQSWLLTPFRQRARRSWALLLVALRVITVLFAMQLGGVIHGTADLLDAVAETAEGEHEHCPPDGPCDDCPPGCPNCHCAAAHGSVAPEPALTSVPEPALGAVALQLEGSQKPAGPELPALFRPPRA